MTIARNSIQVVLCVSACCLGGCSSNGKGNSEQTTTQNTSEDASGSDATQTQGTSDASGQESASTTESTGETTNTGGSDASEESESDVNQTTSVGGDDSTLEMSSETQEGDSSSADGSSETETDSTSTTTTDSTDQVDPCANFESIVSKELFDTIFPLDLRNPAYTYEGMVEATKSYPEFATTGECDDRKREVAAIFANITREVGCLQFIEQIDKSTGPYCDSSRPYGCPAGADAYYGRGPIQLSWNYNYYTAGEALGLDLLNSPDLVAQDSKVAWQTALWFWTTAGGGDRSPHTAITSGEGFGATIQMINGWEECNGGSVGYASEAVTVRVCAFQAYTELLGTDVGPGDLNCGTELMPCPKGCMD